MKLEFELSTDMTMLDVIDDLTKWNLVDMKNRIEIDLNPEEVELWDALCVVLGYICKPSELIEMENDTDPAWIDMVSKL